MLLKFYLGKILFILSLIFLNFLQTYSQKFKLIFVEKKIPVSKFLIIRSEKGCFSSRIFLQ